MVVLLKMKKKEHVLNREAIKKGNMLRICIEFDDYVYNWLEHE